jgi:hypothetical protein
VHTGSVCRFVRYLKVFTRLGPLLTLVSAVAVIVLERSPLGVITGLGGALAGLLLELAATQIGLLVGALAFGLHVTHVIIGVGGELRHWTSPARRVVLRNIPVLIQVGLAGKRAPVRLRLWLTGACSALTAFLSVGAAWSTTGAPFGRGLAVGATACLAHSLRPRRGSGATSLGWFLFGLPRLTGRPAAELAATPLVRRSTDALHAGDLDTAEKIAAQLVEQHPELITATGAQVAVLAARGRYAEALLQVSHLVGRKDLQQRDMALVMSTMAGLTATAVEAGQLPAEIGVPMARRSADGAMEIGYPSHRFNGTLALITLLEGDAVKAVELARYGCESSEQALDRVDDLVTLARAQMASGDNATARVTLAEAEELAPWWPRVAATRARLSIG